MLSSPQERKLLLSTASIQELEAGERFIAEGEQVNALFFLLEGQVKLCREDLLGRSRIIRLSPPRSVVGLRTFIAETKSGSSAIAIGKVRLYVIPRATIMTLLNKNIGFALHLLTSLALRLEKLEKRTLELQQKQLRGRLADTLLMLAEYYGYEEDGTTLSAQLTRGEIASLSHMTDSNASRTLSAFASEHMIALEKRTISLLDLPALEHASRIG